MVVTTALNDIGTTDDDDGFATDLALGTVAFGVWIESELRR